MIANPKPAIPAQRDPASVPGSGFPGALGNRRLFADPAYHFQALRVLNEVANGGADVTECLETIGLIHGGDAGGWYDAWAATAERNIARAEAARDPISKGLAFLRAHNYWRTAEFLLKPDDVRRPPAWASQVDAFDRGLQALGIAHERTSVPYQNGALRALFYPGPPGWEAKPLIVLVGGGDSTLEELYFELVPAAYQRGYGVLTYEGPGQGAALREHELFFTPAWEKPNAAVFDAYLGTHAKPPSIVLIGMSMGGYFAPRAAAFEPRIDGVVSFDVFYDLPAIARRFEGLSRDPATSGDSGVTQIIGTMRWGLGVQTLDEVLERSSGYTLARVAGQISCDVLVLAGTEDGFVPVAQVAAYVAALTGARSVETAIYDRASGGAEHCQEGASTLWHETFFDWLARHFPNPTVPDLASAITDAMTSEGVEKMIELFAPEGEWVIMATGETFRGHDQIRQLATRSIAGRDHPAGEGIKPFNVFSNPDGTRICWEYVHTGVVTDQWPASTHRPAVGTKLDMPILLSCDCRDGKLVKIREYFDMWSIVDPGKPHQLYS